jgi:ATP-dependent helicase/nuclease subunit A
VGALTRIVRRFEQVYAEAKRAANVMDYDDLEHLTLEALRQGPIAAEYREKFRWIAVDEYQDSNRVQEAILSRICRGSNLFFVGDVKQSIYRFRQAEPGLFWKSSRSFPAIRVRESIFPATSAAPKRCLRRSTRCLGAILKNRPGYRL